MVEDADLEEVIVYLGEEGNGGDVIVCGRRSAEDVELVGPKLQVPLYRRTVPRRRMRGCPNEFLFCSLASCFKIIFIAKV